MNITPLFQRISILLALCFCTSILYAQEQSTRDLAELSLVELLSIKVEVASKSEEKTELAPSSVFVISQQEMRNMGATTLEEVLNFVPGFQVLREVEQGNATRISVRGGTSALSSSVLFLINGERMNDLYTGGVSLLNRMIAIENIKQIEIIRGPGSALYGSNAFLGVVNIVLDFEQTYATLYSAGWDRKGAALQLSGRVNEDFKYSVFVKSFEDKGADFQQAMDIFGKTEDTSDPSSGSDMFAHFQFKKVSANYRYTTREFSNFLSFGALGDHSNSEQLEKSTLSVDYDWVSTDRLKVEVGGGLSHDHWRAVTMINPKDVNGFEEAFIGGPLLGSYRGDLHADINVELVPSNHFTAGMSYANTGISHVANVMSHDPLTLDYKGGLVEFAEDQSFNETVTRNILGVYVQNQQQIGTDLSITAGLRMDYYSDFGGSLNPRVAVVYSTPFNSSFKALYGSAYRAPNFLELYDRYNPVDYGNADLSPERISTCEFAYIQHFNKFHGSATFFVNDTENVIQLGDVVDAEDNPLGARGFENAEGFTSQGLEFDFKWVPSTRFYVNGTFTHLFNEVANIVYDNSGSLLLNYTVGGFNFNVNGVIRNTVRQLPDQGAVAVFNSTLKYTTPSNVTLFGTVSNLLDEEYKTSSTLLPTGIPNRGRMFMFGLRLDLSARKSN